MEEKQNKRWGKFFRSTIKGQPWKCWNGYLMTSWSAMLSVKEPFDLPRHYQAMRRTSIPAALNYYGANWPAEPYAPPSTDFKVSCPTLCIYGEKDEFLFVDALDGTHRFVDNDLSIEIIARAEHFVHNDTRQQVTRILSDWLERTE